MLGSGAFNFGGFGTCNVTNSEIDPATDTLRKFSPVIAQFNSDGLKLINNSLFPTVAGDEFSFTGLFGSFGTFTYSPGAGDPNVRYWATTDGQSEFELSWFVADANVNLCAADTKDTSCLAAAVAIPTTTPLVWRTLG